MTDTQSPNQFKMRHSQPGLIIEARLSLRNSGLSRVWTVFIDGKQTSCWSAVSATHALKRFNAGIGH